METITTNRKELKKIMRETFVDVLTNRRDLIEDAVLEAIEDVGLAKAIEAGRRGEYVDTKKFLKKLDAKVKSKNLK
jgi:lipoate-protein ligase B